MDKERNRGGSKTVGVATVIAEDAFSRPANTTAYADGDGMSDNATAGSATVLEFDNVAVAEYGSGTVVSAMLFSSANKSTKLEADLHLFDTEPGALGDNAAADLTDAEALTCIGTIPFDTWHETNATADAGGNCHSLGNKGVFPFVCTGTTQLWGVLIARNAYTPVSGETFTVRLQVNPN